MQKLILLVDDDQDEFLILNEAVEMAGLPCYCLWANGADRAERLLQHILPDLILIDYNMPVTNGMACLRNIRKMYNLRQVPIVMYSNHINDTTREQARNEGAVCMQKTASIEQLVKHLSILAGEGKAISNFA
ncbi:response regulator [Paraflavitalea soli]|uniref:Response regulator n=1 Tax=Paraflavitalea soli TaxID=2315862 RepID=A0A3B7MQ00_9BACT|nr:response regulator [Paraflavitalea soli]AXY72711.1 response regulator [Paraflavitalea soli]